MRKHPEAGLQNRQRKVMENTSAIPAPPGKSLYMGEDQGRFSI